MESSYLSWSILLVLGVPFLIIGFNEVIDRFRLRGSSYVPVLYMIRDIVLPLMVFLMVLRFVFSVDAQNTPAKIVSTLFWIVFLVAIFRFSRVMVGSGDYENSDWRSRVPQLFLRLPPYAIIGVVVFHIIQDLWSLPVKEMATTLGIGSIVIALALQDTLSNLVSGLLLVANSPFKTGDWVHVGDVEGKIIAVNWRYTHLQTRNGDLIVIPNGSIAGESIENHNRPTQLTAATIPVHIAVSVAPNDAKKLLIDVALRTPGVFADPAPVVTLVKLRNPVVEYEMVLWVDGHEDKPDIVGDFLSRTWYASHRENVELPMVSQQYYRHDARTNGAAVDSNEEQLIQKLNSLPNFSLLSHESKIDIGQAAELQKYATAEHIVSVGETEPGLFVVTSGSITLQIKGANGQEQILDRLTPGGIFGENGLVGRTVSSVTAVVDVDSELLLIPHEVFNRILNRNADLATAIDALVNRRNRVRKNLLGDVGNSRITKLPVSYSAKRETT